MRRRARPVDAGCVGRGSNGAIPCAHQGTRHARCEVWFPIGPRPPRAAVDALVAGFVRAPLAGQPDLRPAVADYVAATGDCVIHACAVVAGMADRCSCAACDQHDPRRPWRDLDIRLAAEAGS